MPPKKKATLPKNDQENDEKNEKIDEVDFSDVKKVLSDKVDGKEIDIIKFAEKIANKINTDTYNDELYDEFISDLIFYSFEEESLIKCFSDLFLDKKMYDFSKSVLETLSGQFADDPLLSSKLILYVTSRVAQYRSNIYDFVLDLLYSIILSNSGSEIFHMYIDGYKHIVEFQTEVTYVKIQWQMQESFGKIAGQVRSGSEIYGTLQFLNIIRFWSNFAYKFENFGACLTSIIVNTMRADSSLKLNPLRIHLCSILIENKEFIPAISPLTKVMSKTFSSKQNQDLTELDFDLLVSSEKDIARQKLYQEIMFDKSYTFLCTCLENIKTHIAFPEITAPVVKYIDLIEKDESFHTKQRDLSSLKNKIIQNSKFIDDIREALNIESGLNLKDMTSVDKINNANIPKTIFI